MKRTLLPLLLLLAACSSDPAVMDAELPEPASKETIYADIIPTKDTLVASPDEFGSSLAFISEKGDTIIPAGEFDHCFSSIFTTFMYVADKRFKDRGMVAVNRNKEIIFDAFIYDNGPDYIKEGLFRIKRNGKIGFADPTGKVIIDAKYSCAYPFENGKAKVALNCETTEDGEHSSWESDEWFFIDKKGTKVE